MKSTTNINVNAAQYNQIIVDNLKLEFVPIYHNGRFASMTFHISDIDSSRTVFNANIDAFRDFDLKGRVRGRIQNIVFRLKGRFTYGTGTDKIEFTSKVILAAGCYEVRYN